MCPWTQSNWVRKYSPTYTFTFTYNFPTVNTYILILMEVGFQSIILLFYGNIFVLCYTNVIQRWMLMMLKDFWKMLKLKKYNMCDIWIIVGAVVGQLLHSYNFSWCHRTSICTHLCIPKMFKIDLAGKWLNR